MATDHITKIPQTATIRPEAAATPIQTTMNTPEQLATLLTGSEYPLELSKDMIKEAKASGLVIVYGASDDLCEFDGAISDEAGCLDGGEIFFNASGYIESPDDDETEVLKKFNVLDQVTQGGAKFEAVWGEETEDGRDCSWCYKVPFPCARFDIMEDGQLYCEGFVFRLEDALTKLP